MEVFRVDISSWTASFRFPNMISGYQPSLKVPPISTVFGLLSAAAGRPVSPTEAGFAFLFRYEMSAVDLETIYQFGTSGKRSLQAKSNVIRREFLAGTRLTLYLDSAEIAAHFKQPYYPLLLGRSGDLATVDNIQQVTIEATDKLDLAGTVVPFIGHTLAAPIQALPTHFTNTIPRRNVGTQPFYVLDWQRRGIYRLDKPGWRDPERDWDLYWYSPDNFVDARK